MKQKTDSIRRTILVSSVLAGAIAFALFRNPHPNDMVTNSIGRLASFIQRADSSAPSTKAQVGTKEIDSIALSPEVKASAQALAHYFENEEVPQTLRQQYEAFKEEQIALYSEIDEIIELNRKLSDDRKLNGSTNGDSAQLATEHDEAVARARSRYESYVEKNRELQKQLSAHIERQLAIN